MPITCIVGIIYVAIRVVIVKRNMIKVEWPKEIIKLLFICYLTGLISLVVFPVNFWVECFNGVFSGWWSVGQFSLVPSFIKVLLGELTIDRWGITMLIWNIVMFLPLGFFLPFVTERVNKNNIFVVAIVVPLFIELWQVFIGRSFDVDDLICNYLGIITGFFVGHAIHR